MPDNTSAPPEDNLLIPSDRELVTKLVKALQTNPDLIKRLSRSILEDDAEVNTIANANRYGDAIRAGRVPYYKLSYANSLMPILVELKASGTNKIIPYALFPHIAKDTLKNRINQSWLFIIDHLDPQGDWALLRDHVEVQKHKAGILLRFLSQPGPKDILSAISVDDVQELDFVEVRQKLEELIRTAEIGKKYDITGFHLKEGDIAQLQESTMTLENFAIEIEKRKITIRRLE